MRAHAEVPTKLQALSAPTLELATGRPAVRVDLTRIGLIAGAQVGAAAVGARRKCIETEVSWLKPQREIGAADSAPTHEIFRWNEYATVMSGAATRAALEAIQRAVGLVAEGAPGFWRDFGQTRRVRSARVQGNPKDCRMLLGPSRPAWVGSST